MTDFFFPLPSTLRTCGMPACVRKTDSNSDVLPAQTKNPGEM